MSRLKGEYATAAAAGTTQSDAAEVSAYTVMVTSGSGGVLLPPMNKDEECVVCNGVSTIDLSIYPRSGGQINNSTANLPLVLPANKAARFRAIDGLNVIAFF